MRTSSFGCIVVFLFIVNFTSPQKCSSCLTDWVYSMGEQLAQRYTVMSSHAVLGIWWPVSSAIAIGLLFCFGWLSQYSKVLTSGSYHSGTCLDYACGQRSVATYCSETLVLCLCSANFTHVALAFARCYSTLGDNMASDHAMLVLNRQGAFICKHVPALQYALQTSQEECRVAIVACQPVAEFQQPSVCSLYVKAVAGQPVPLLSPKHVLPLISKLCRPRDSPHVTHSLLFCFAGSALTHVRVCSPDQCG